MAERSSKKSASSAQARVPARRADHGENIASTLARIAVKLATSPRDVTVQMATVKEAFCERAAIREYLGGMLRETAENMAIRDTCAVLGLLYVET